MAGGGFILGGLLKGLGSGLTMNAQQKREDALLALRRQYQLEDANTADAREIAKEGRAETRDIASDTRDAAVKTGLLEVANRYAQQQGETKQAYEERLIRIRGEEDRKGATHKGGIDRGLEAFRSKLDTARDAESIKLKAEIDGGQVKSVEAADDGSMLVTYTNGSVVKKNVKLRETRRETEGSDGEGSISGARNRRDGTAAPAAAPKAAAKPTNTPSSLASQPAAAA